MWLVIITGETDDTVYRLTEDAARFEQQEAETTDDMALPCNPVLESRSFLCMFRFLAVQFGPVFGLQLHQLKAVVVLYGLDFILQPFDGFLVRGNLTAQILYFIFQGFRFSGSPTDSGVQKLASFFLVQSGAFLADSPVKVFTLPFIFICLFDKGVGNAFRCIFLFAISS